MRKYIPFFLMILFGLNSCIQPRLETSLKNHIGVATYQGALKAESYGSSSPCVQKWKDKKINKDYHLSNGNLVHVYPAGCGCLVHREFDKKTKLLVGYKLEGERCARL